MNKLSLIIHKNQYLFEIFKEIKLDTQYQLFLSHNNTDEIIKNLKKENKDFLTIIFDINDSNIENSLLIEKPTKLLNLLQKVSLAFLKTKYSVTSNISIGKYKINLNSRQISLGNSNLKLTEKELELIMYLYDSKNEKKSSHISKDVWGHSENVETHTVETHIYRLRKKIVNKFNDNDFLVYNKLGYRIR